MKNLIIIGAGGLGREVFGFAEVNPARGRDWEIKGFLDDRPNILDNVYHEVGVVGCCRTYIPEPDDVFLTAIMDPRVRDRYTKIMLEKGAQFINLIDKTAIIGRNVALGVGNIFCHEVIISCDVKIGNFGIFNTFVSIGHDSEIGDFVSLHTRSIISGNVRIHDYAEIGANATVLPKAIVEAGAVVGAGSVLLRRAPEGKTMMGVPAKLFEYST